jgi:pimeloyl-ACP methyl ester carboxylesterase
MTFHLGRLTRRTVFRFLAFAASSLAWAGTASAQNIDTDQQVAPPVPHRYIHSVLGDAEFQIALPNNWNGKLLIGARGFSGDELASGAFKTVGLQKGYAYALSDQGWYRFDIVDHPEDKYFESRRRINQLTHVTKAIVAQHYGRSASRTFMVGGSNGGHNTKMMVEDYPEQYDGRVAGYGITSHIEWMGSRTRFLRNYDIIAPRIADIIAKRTASPNWNPDGEPLSPPLTNAQLEALRNIYNMPARVQNIAFNIGMAVGSEYRWGPNYPSNLGYAQTSVAKFDRFYDPDGNGVLSDAEIKAWDPNFSRPPVANDLRRFDNTGNLKRPIIIAHGSHDPIVSPGETAAYKRLVEQRFGVAGARNWLAVYYIPRMAHGGTEYDRSISAQLDILEAWVTWHQTGGKSGSLPPNTLVGELGSYPRD